MSVILRVLLLYWVCALPLMASGFSQPVQAVKLDYGQKEALIIFDADRSIRKAKPLCECTKTSFAGSRLTARVDTSGFSRDVEKQIDVTLEDGSKERLTMRFSVPQAVILSMRTIVWKQGGAPAAKELRIQLPPGSPVHRVTEASITGDAFDYVPHTVKEGAEYSVSITPRSTEKKVLNRLIIKTDSADPRYAQYIIYLSIQPL